MTRAKSFFIMNFYLIGTLIIIAGYIWMISLAAMGGGNMTQVLTAFFFTLSGLIFWTIAYYSGGDRHKKDAAYYKSAAKYGDKTPDKNEGSGEDGSSE